MANLHFPCTLLVQSTALATEQRRSIMCALRTCALPEHYVKCMVLRQGRAWRSSTPTRPVARGHPAAAHACLEPYQNPNDRLQAAIGRLRMGTAVKIIMGFSHPGLQPAPAERISRLLNLRCAAVCSRGHGKCGC